MALQGVLFLPAADALPPYTFDRSSSAYEINDRGAIQLRSSDALRVDYIDFDNDGERELPTLLVEPDSTNRLRQATEMAATTWARNDVAVSSGYGLGADLSSTSAVMVYPSTVNGTHYLSQAGVAVTASTDHAVSVYASPAGLNYMTIDLANSSGNYAVRSLFELTSSGAVLDSTTVGSGSFRYSRIDRLRDGCYRCTMVGGLSTSTVAEARFWPRHSTAIAPTWAGGGSSAGFGVLLWGAQLETARSQPTSLIVTAGAAASRGADALSFPWPYAPAAACGRVRFQELEAPNWVSDGGSDRRVWSIGGALGVAPRLYISKPAGGDSYRLTLNVDAATATATVDLNPAHDDFIDLFWWLYSDGSVMLAGRKMTPGGAWGSITTSARSSGIGLPGAWSEELLYIGAVTGAADATQLRLLDFVAMLGSDGTTAELLSLAPFFVIDGIAVPVAVDSVRETPDDMGDRGRTFDGTMRETVRNRPSKWEAETVPLSVKDRNRVRQALQSSTQPVTVYGQMARTSTGGVPTVFTRPLGETIVQSSTERKYALRFSAEQSS